MANQTRSFEPIELLPDPAGLIEGLRDTGYEVNTALADIIDNSIDANASTIDIELKMDTEGDIAVIISDDGHGMDKAALLKGMTYGGKGNDDPKRLGKFGLGMKTASTAFCRRLVVITRSASDKEINKGIWDLDHVVKERKWELLQDEPEEDEIELLEDISKGGPGTVVVWEKVDRLLKNYADPTGKPAQKGLDRIIDEFTHHVATVFQRFLDHDDSRARNIIININGDVVKARDPFCSSEEQTEIVAEETQKVEYEEGKTTEFTIKAYVLPRKEQFSDPEAHKNARLNNPNQGIYVYRENRLIHSADWMGMYQKEPHYTLLRVEFSFNHELDQGFDVDIKKSRINLDSSLYDFIKDNFLPGPRTAANERYRKGVKRAIGKKSKGAHDDSNKNIGSKEEGVKGSNITVTDAETGEAEVQNKQGKFKMRIVLSTKQGENEIHVLPVDSIDDGKLYEPTYVDNKYHGVKINMGHPYYHKVYLPNIRSGVLVQGMDSLLWALAEAEFSSVTSDTRKHFEELRYEVSRILRSLVEDLPEPDLDGEEQD